MTEKKDVFDKIHADLTKDMCNMVDILQKGVVSNEEVFETKDLKQIRHKVSCLEELLTEIINTRKE